MSGEELYDDFNPATMEDDVIYIGSRKYVAADIADELLAALKELVGDACLDFFGEPIGFVKARAAIAKATESTATSSRRA